MDRRWPVLALIALALAGCSYFDPRKVPDPPPLDPGLYPAKYKSDVADFMRSHLRNAARDAYIGDPVLKPISGIPHYVTCVRYNLRGTNNTDAGNESKYIIFLGGHLNQVLPGGPEQCSGLNYQRYPEIEFKGAS
jgi:hypothetical protein